MRCLYGVDQLEDTSTASALVLIGQLHKVKVIHLGAESVCQNCVIGRHAHLYICILLHLPYLFILFLFLKYKARA